MRAISLAEINANNRAFWQRACADQHALLQLRYIRRFIKGRFCDPAGPSYCISPSALHQEQSFFAHLLTEKARFSADQQTRAKEPRRKALATGQSPRQLVAQFMSDPVWSPCRTKSLWKPFFVFLDSRGLGPTKGKDHYQFSGKAKPVRISFRRFEKLISELAPRRRARYPN